MVIKIDKSFDKDLKKVTDKVVLKKVLEVYENVAEVKTVADIKGLKKLSGFKSYYRIRVGDYRIGLRIIDSVAYFERILLRKEIYREYP